MVAVSLRLRAHRTLVVRPRKTELVTAQGAPRMKNAQRGRPLLDSEPFLVQLYAQSYLQT
jgi:hypothetical protein